MKRLKKIIIRSLLNKLYRKRWIKIAIALAIIMSIVVVLLGIILLNNSKNALRNSVLNNHKAIITRAASEINLLFQQSEELLNTTATLLSAIYSEPWRQETVLVGLVLNQPIFSRAALLDLSAKAIASSELGEAVSWNYAKDAIKKS